MRRSGSLFGLLGLLFLAFGFAGALIVDRPLSDLYVLGNLVLGAGVAMGVMPRPVSETTTATKRSSA